MCTCLTMTYSIHKRRFAYPLLFCHSFHSSYRNDSSILRLAYRTGYYAHITIQKKRKNCWTNPLSAITSSKCHLYLASLDLIPAFLIVNSCQVDVCDGIIVLLLHSPVLHVVSNEVHMPSRDRCERWASSKFSSMFFFIAYDHPPLSESVRRNS